MVHEWILNLRLHPAAAVEAGLARWGESGQQHVLQAIRCIHIIINITECPPHVDSSNLYLALFLRTEVIKYTLQEDKTHHMKKS